MQVTSREELEVWAEPCAVAAGRDRGDCERAGGGGGGGEEEFYRVTLTHPRSRPE